MHFFSVACLQLSEGYVFVLVYIVRLTRVMFEPVCVMMRGKDGISLKQDTLTVSYPLSTVSSML